jgi:hypothetical protein
MLAVALPSEAKVVYTPAHVRIFPDKRVPLNLDHAGKAEFTLKDTFSTTSAGFYREGALSVLPGETNEIWGHTTGSGLHYASALPAGVRVGNNGAFSAGARSLAYGGQEGTSIFCEGKWNDVKNRYLGLKFAIHGKVHFGWARLNVTCNVSHAGRIHALLTGYAYETVPNKPIITCKTKGDAITLRLAGVGHLAAGTAVPRQPVKMAQ